jgi:hypothetical protein
LASNERKLVSSNMSLNLLKNILLYKNFSSFVIESDIINEDIHWKKIKRNWQTITLLT